MDLKVSLVWCWTGADWTTTKIGIFNLGLEQKSLFFFVHQSCKLSSSDDFFSLNLSSDARPVWHRPRTEHLQLSLREADDAVMSIAAPQLNWLC